MTSAGGHSGDLPPARYIGALDLLRKNVGWEQPGDKGPWGLTSFEGPSLGRDRLGGTVFEEGPSVPRERRYQRRSLGKDGPSSKMVGVDVLRGGTFWRLKFHAISAGDITDSAAEDGGVRDGALAGESPPTNGRRL